jgi:hypothetical protein
MLDCIGESVVLEEPKETFGSSGTTDSPIQSLDTISRLLGEITKGVCRHRAILYKYLCDRLGIDCELKRGNYSGSNASGAHSWNIIKLGMQYFVVDIMHEPTQLYSIESEKAKHYLRVGCVDGELKLITETERYVK